CSSAIRTRTRSRGLIAPGSAYPAPAPATSPGASQRLSDFNARPSSRPDPLASTRRRQLL
ncbi:MAG: hypothetical protein AVDCRST_MAG69-2577, partial [uncultured Solirubrobacteraceae bacterium]